MQTGSKIEFYTEPRTSFRAASTKKNSIIGAYTATSIVYADIFGEPASVTIEFECPTSWALGCLPQKDNRDISQRARYVSITMPDGLKKIFLVDEADIKELDSDNSSISIKAYSPEYWMSIVPSTIKNANLKFTTNQKYSDILTTTINMYSIGYEEEKINNISFRDLPILAYDSSYEPTDYEKLYYGVVKHDIGYSPVDEKPAANISSTDIIPSYPEPQGNKISELMKSFPYLLSTNGTTQEVEYRQDFDMILIPANSPYNDGCLWWRWVMRPKTSSSMYFSRANGAINDNSKIHIASKSSTLVYLPDDSNGNPRKNIASIGGSVYTGVWNSISAQQAEANGISGSDMTYFDAVKIAAADAASLSPIIVDVTANGDNIHNMIRPGMQAVVRYGYQTMKFTISEVDYSFDSDSGWSISIPLTVKTKSISYIYTPKTERHNDENIENPDVENPIINDDNPSAPGIPSTPDIPSIPTVNPYNPDDNTNNSDNNNPVKIIISDNIGDNLARAGLIRTIDGRWYAICTDSHAAIKTSFMKPIIKKLDIPADAKFASKWSTSYEDNGKLKSTAFIVSSSGKTMYKIQITNNKVSIYQGTLPGKYISMYMADLNSSWVITSSGKYNIVDSFGGLSFNAIANNPNLNGWIKGIKEVLTDGEQYYILAENGFFGSDGTCLMPAPKSSYPVGIILPNAVVYSTGVYYSNSVGYDKWNKVKSRFDGNIIGISKSVNSDIRSSIIWTKYSVYICSNGFNIYKIFSTNKNNTINNVYVSNAGNMIKYIDNISLCITYKEGGYTTIYGSDKTWTHCKDVKCEKITALTGFSNSKITNTRELTADDDLLSYAGVMYATKDGIYSPSLSGDSKLQVALPNNGIIKVAGSKPFFDGIDFNCVAEPDTSDLITLIAEYIGIVLTGKNFTGKSTAVFDDYAGGRSLWMSKDGRVWLIDTDATKDKNIAASDISEISSKTGIATDIVENDGDLIIVSNKGIVDETGARKDEGITITNPLVIKDSYGGGFYVGSNENGLWKILPGMKGISGAKNTMIKQVPANGLINNIQEHFASGPEEAWLGDRATLYPVTDIVQDSLINEPIWITPTMGIVEFNDNKNPYPSGKGNVGIIQKKLRRAPLKQKYNHIDYIVGDPRKAGYNMNLNNMSDWDGAAILWNDEGKYAFIGTKMVNGSKLNFSDEYTMPTGEIVVGVVYGYGILSSSGKMYCLDSAGSITGNTINLGHGIKGTWRVVSGRWYINIGWQIVLGSDNSWYQILNSDGTYTLKSIQGMSGSTILSYVFITDSSSYVATDNGIYKYDGEKSLASKILSDSNIKEIIAPTKTYEIGHGVHNLIGVLKNDGLYELASDDGLHKYDDITGSIYDIIWNDKYSIMISTDNGVWVLGQSVKPYKIQNLTLKTGIKYPYINTDDTDNKIFAQVVKSTGEAGTITTSDGKKTDALFNDNSFKINGQVSSIHYGAKSGQTNYFGTESYGYLPSVGFKSAPWLTSDEPNCQYAANSVYIGTNSGRMYGKYGAFIGAYGKYGLSGSIFMLQSTEYGTIKDVWFGGAYNMALILTTNALLSVNNDNTLKPIVVKLIDIKQSDSIRFVGRDDPYEFLNIMASPYIIINGSLKYVDCESYNGTNRKIYILKDISGLTGTVLYANPAEINESNKDSTGFAITNTGYWSIKNGTAKKITGVYSNPDGTDSNRQLEPLTAEPSVAIDELWRDEWSYGKDMGDWYKTIFAFPGVIIIARSKQDGGGAMIMSLQIDGSLASVLEIPELSSIGNTSTDRIYGGANVKGFPASNLSGDGLQSTRGSALAQVGEHVYAIAPKIGIGSSDAGVSYSIEDITKKISDAATDSVVS